MSLYVLLVLQRCYRQSTALNLQIYLSMDIFYLGGILNLQKRIVLGRNNISVTIAYFFAYAFFLA